MIRSLPRSELYSGDAMNFFRVLVCPFSRSDKNTQNTRKRLDDYERNSGYIALIEDKDMDFRGLAAKVVSYFSNIWTRVLDSCGRRSFSRIGDD